MRSSSKIDGFGRAIVVAAFSGAFAMTAFGCDSTPSPSSPSATEYERIAVDKQLTSAPWRLESYRPAGAGDVLMTGLVALQVQKLEVRFDGSWMRASSPTMKLDVPYTIRDAGAGHFTLETRYQGLLYVTRCAFVDNGAGIQFQSQTSPWQGEGMVVRVR